MKFDEMTGTAEFKVDLTGEVTKQTYRGVFKVKCLLTPLDVINADKLYRDLLGDTNPILAEEKAQNMAFILSQLKYRIIEAPYFWKSEDANIDGGHIVDTNVLLNVFEKTIEAETKYRESLKKETEKNEKLLKKEVENFEETEEVTEEFAGMTDEEVELMKRSEK